MSAREAPVSAQTRPSDTFAVSAPSERAILIRAQQISAVYRPMPLTFAATVIGGLLLVIALSREVPGQTLAIWLTAQWAAASYMLLLYFQYTRAAPSPEQAGKWGTRLVIAMFLLGCAWGSAGIVMFQPLFTPYQLVLTFGLFMVTIVCMAGGLTSFIPTVYAIAPPTIVPLIVRMLLEGDFVHLLVAAGGILVLALTLYYARHLSGLIAESFNMRFENVLERNRAEAASRAKTRFLASASHDLRQPLHTLSLYSAALKLHAPDGATGDIAMHIDKALTSLSVLVNSLLDISKLDAGAVQPELQPVNVKSVIERIQTDYEPVAHAKGLELRIRSSDSVVRTDPVLLERLVRNLVDNAFKYTATGSVTLSSEADDSTVRISVRDTGPGIPAAERERVFEEFYQLGNPERDRSQGLGLGLAIVRRLVELLGLELELESETGRGSVFTVKLPRESENRTMSPTTSASVEAQTRGLSGVQVLVIDDEAEVRAGMRTLLECLGCRVTACSGYAEAEQLLDQHALHVDVIIADFRLRQHENGIDTVRRLRDRLGAVPALLVSGDTAPERLREAQSSGLPLLHKPVSAEKLTETILAVLRH
jgi:signal transduction histidine kinase/CheY-like chemotaxis protein